jgi:hypothetical protein
VNDTARRSLRTGLIAGLATLAVLAGTVGSYAYWSAGASATLGAGAATLSTSTSGWASTTLGNEDIPATGSTSLTSTGSITITNTTTTTSSQVPTLTTTFSRASGDAGLAGATTVTVWSVASAASCTPAATPVSPTSGTWSAGVSVSTSLAAGASVTYCVRNTVSDRQNVAVSTGSRTFTPQASAQLSIGNFTGGSTATSTISTDYVYPLQSISAGTWWYVTRALTTWCWDVSGSGTTSGSLLISYACKNNSDTNQDFRFVDADADGYGDFQARHTSALRVAAAASTTSGSAVTMVTANTASATQQWQPQLVAANTYQFVNRHSGLCLSMPAVSSGTATQVTCDGGADQRFTLTQRSTVQLQGFTCTSIGSNQNRTVTYSWVSEPGGPFTVQARQNGSGAWTTIATTSGNSATVAAPIGAPLTSWGAGTYDVQVLNGSGQQVATDTITVTGVYIFFVILDYYYARC